MDAAVAIHQFGERRKVSGAQLFQLAVFQNSVHDFVPAGQFFQGLLRGGQRAHEPTLVATEELDSKAPCPVEHHVPAGDRSERLFLLEQHDEQNRQQRQKRRFHQLRRQQRNPRRSRAARGKHDGDGRFTFHAIAAARKVASDAAKRLPEHQPGNR